MEALFDFNQSAFRALLTDAAERAAERAAELLLRELPRPDPQYTVAAVAELLALDASTVRAYLELPVTHPRHLPATRCTDSGRGNRIRLSEVLAWQARNTQAGPVAEAAGDQPQAPAALMEISHRRAARRQGREQSRAAA